MRNSFLILYLILFIFLLKSNFCFSQYEQMRPVSYNANYTSIDGRDLGFDRFHDSPCYDKLGFSPYLDREELDRRYIECEHDYYLNLFYKIAISVIFLIVIVYMIRLAIKKRK